MNSTTNGHTNRSANGRTNGHTGGPSNGHPNGTVGTNRSEQTGGADDERAAAYLARTLRHDIDAAGETRAAAALLVWLAAETEQWARSLNLPRHARAELLTLACEARTRVREARRVKDC